jgi:hypothetical protein
MSRSQARQGRPDESDDWITVHGSDVGCRHVPCSAPCISLLSPVLAPVIFASVLRFRPIFQRLPEVDAFFRPLLQAFTGLSAKCLRVPNPRLQNEPAESGPQTVLQNEPGENSRRRARERDASRQLEQIAGVAGEYFSRSAAGMGSASTAREWCRGLGCGPIRLIHAGLPRAGS